MKKTLINEYAEIHYVELYKIVTVKWLPSNERMSELEFHELLHAIFDMTTSFETNIIYVDAYDFNYPVLKNTTALVNNLLEKCPVINFKIVKSRHILGNNGILRLIRDINSSRFRLKIYETRESGESWLNALTTAKKNKENTS